MKRSEIARLAIIAIVTAVISVFISGMIFTSPSKRTAKVPVAQAISSNFPDVTNDPNYNFFLNSSALDPTQPIQIGNSQNSTPFNNAH